MNLAIGIIAPLAAWSFLCFACGRYYEGCLWEKMLKDRK
jgi:hypothetical protein